MRTGILLNPGAGGAAGAADALRALVERTAARVEQISGAGRGTEAALRMIEDGVERLFAAGGDGTVHQAANAILRARRPVTLGVVPLGTGNDFARALGLPLDAEEAVEVLAAAETRTVDAFEVEHGSGGAFGVNAAQGGFAVEALRAAATEPKVGRGLLAYLAQAAGGLEELRTYRASLAWDGGPAETHLIANLTVANGGTVAGGIPVAPDSSVEDGLLDVVLVPGGTLPELAPVAARLMLGAHVEADGVVHRRARRLAVRSDPPMAFSVDGEELTTGTMEFRILPGALRVLVGPDYRSAREEPE